MKLITVFAYPRYPQQAVSRAPMGRMYSYGAPRECATCVVRLQRAWEKNNKRLTVNYLRSTQQINMESLGQRFFEFYLLRKMASSIGIRDEFFHDRTRLELHDDLVEFRGRGLF